MLVSARALDTHAVPHVAAARLHSPAITSAHLVGGRESADARCWARAQAAAASTLTAAGPDSLPDWSQPCAPLATRRSVDPDAADHKAGTLSFRLPDGLGRGPVRLSFVYGSGGYSRADLGLFPAPP
jgi:hypothetical protein